MRTVDTTPAAAEQLLARIAYHLPPDVVIGRPLLATADAVVIDAEGEDDPVTIWTLEDDGEVCRFVSYPDGPAELTWYYMRRVVRTAVGVLD